MSGSNQKLWIFEIFFMKLMTLKSYNLLLIWKEVSSQEEKKIFFTPDNPRP